MATVLEGLIIRGARTRQIANTMVDALELVLDAANSHLEDLESGLEQGIYDKTEASGRECKALSAALKLLNTQE